ncbi:MAG: response regulator transcription factor [Planctomycetes bacterium]|nr:response regulator transcription factor [Planctomycetota bacterium]
MAKKTLLLVEDDDDLLEVLRLTFEAEGFRCLVADNGEDALTLCRRHGPDLVILDLMLPGIDGIEVCTEIKRDRALSRTPILMLTAKSEESDVVLGLGVGADDYVTKPARPRELVARVRNILRRPLASDSVIADQVVSVGGVVIDPTRFEVRAGDLAIRLTPAEFKLLQVLAESPGRVFRRGDLLDSVVGPGTVVTERNIDTHVKSLRKKLGGHGDLIETVRGVGYRFTDEAT